MRATSAIPSAPARSGCTTMASADSCGPAGTGMSNAVAMQSSAQARRTSEEDREGRLDAGRGILGAVIGKQILALEDDEGPGFVGDAEDPDVHGRLRRRLVVVLVAPDQVKPRHHLQRGLQVET